MVQETDKFNILKIMGAYVAWVMGSGFATGQEIMQFFTCYGYKSFVLLAINLVGFLIIGPGILGAGQINRDNPEYNHFGFFCGKKLGAFYSWYLPISLFAGMVILISGSGATLKEYFGINHYVGALIMAILAFVSYVIGFQRFVKIVSFIGPTIIAFTVFVGIVTVVRDFDGLSQAAAVSDSMAEKQPVGQWWLAGLLYISYNLTGGSAYYSALGATGATRREAVIGATIGTVVLMAAILLMNTAMLTDIGRTAVLDVPTLYLTKKISVTLGAVFSVILIMGIFSSCSAMMWTVCNKFVKQGTRKGIIFAACAGGMAFFIGLLPFADLIGIVYTLSGYAGFIFVGCVAYKRLKTGIDRNESV